MHSQTMLKSIVRITKIKEGDKASPSFKIITLSSGDPLNDFLRDSAAEWDKLNPSKKFRNEACRDAARYCELCERWIKANKKSTEVKNGEETTSCSGLRKEQNC